MIKNMAGIYILSDNEILMLKRTKIDSFDEFYSIGGKFEKEELNNPIACIYRELKEEANINESDLNNVTLKYIAFRNNKDCISQNYLFFASIKNKDINLPFCDEGILEWVNLEDIFSKKMPPTSYACLKHYFETGKDNDNINVVASTNNNGYGEYVFTELLSFSEYVF